MEPFTDDDDFSFEDHLMDRMEGDSKRKEALELVASCAKDVIEYWPNMSFRTIKVMIPKMQALKEALDMLR